MSVIEHSDGIGCRDVREASAASSLKIRLSSKIAGCVNAVCLTGFGKIYDKPHHCSPFGGHFMKAIIRDSRICYIGGSEVVDMIAAAVAEKVGQWPQGSVARGNQPSPLE